MVLLFLCVPFLVRAQEVTNISNKDITKCCLYWESRVHGRAQVSGRPTHGKGSATTDGSRAASSVSNQALQSQDGPFDDPDRVRELPEQEAIEAIECLLNMEGDLRQSLLVGYTRPQISQFFAPPPSNLAALYYISYIYTQNWLHGGAIALRGCQAATSNPRGEYLTRQEAVAVAYRAYRKWFAEVKRIGLRKAREAGRDPLADTGLEWYGSAGTPKEPCPRQ